MPTVLAVHPSVPARTLDSLIELIRAAPGRYRYGTFGAGTTASLAAELFKSETQLDIREAVAKPPPLTPLMLAAKGEAEILFEPFIVLARGMKEGTAVPVAVMGHSRLSFLPGVPTTVEAGQKQLTAYNWSGLVAPARTPREIILVLNRAVHSVLAEIETQTTFMQHGLQAEGGTPEQLRQFIASELAKWSRALPLSATAPQ
jgi:tripartite-type tricarboxylate transporter receptor subunit TctC